tara:strand:+ start:379 stop:561 length:183 start_codon:yes stop_codon:yes gene_type:complete
MTTTIQVSVFDDGVNLAANAALTPRIASKAMISIGVAVVLYQCALLCGRPMVALITVWRT